MKSVKYKGRSQREKKAFPIFSHSRLTAFSFPLLPVLHCQPCEDRDLEHGHREPGKTMVALDFPKRWPFAVSLSGTPPG